MATGSPEKQCLGAESIQSSTPEPSCKWDLRPQALKAVKLVRLIR